MSIRRVLAIETSCDDTSVAVVDTEGTVVGLRSANQDEAHSPFGGVVPEIAGRNHTKHLLELTDQLLREIDLRISDIDAIAVTSEPGLIGSLLVGVVSAKGLSLAAGKPLLGVNHLEGHLFAGFLRDSTYQPLEGFDSPFLGLVVSGGHTSLIEVLDLGNYRLLGQTVDDAAGEALDKFAKAVGLGFPGGAAVDRAGQSGNSSFHRFPRGKMTDDDFDFSFSGLKTAVNRCLDKLSSEELAKCLSDLCASFEEAIVDVLLHKLERAVFSTGHRRVVITGGVSANSRLRRRALDWGKKNQVAVMIPPLRYCTDNAAMIGYVGVRRLLRGERSNLDLAPSPISRIEGLKPGPALNV